MRAEPDYAAITELAGDRASLEQVRRAFRRYYWVGSYASGADVLEVACGAGQGLAFLATLARSVRAGDVSDAVLSAARAHYGDRFDLKRFAAEDLPYEDRSFDVVAMLEAIYYLSDVSRFVAEARRVLRPGGHLLIATANKDLFDFTPSPFSRTYLGVVELGDVLARGGFAPAFFGDSPLIEGSAWQRVLRPLKRAATAAGIMPEGKAMKAVLKRVVFGRMVPLPAEIHAGAEAGPAPVPIPPGMRDLRHKVIFCAAKRLD